MNANIKLAIVAAISLLHLSAQWGMANSLDENIDVSFDSQWKERTDNYFLIDTILNSDSTQQKIQKLIKNRDLFGFNPSISDEEWLKSPNGKNYQELLDQTIAEYAECRGSLSSLVSNCAREKDNLEILKAIDPNKNLFQKYLSLGKEPQFIDMECVDREKRAYVKVTGTAPESKERIKINKSCVKDLNEFFGYEELRKLLDNAEINPKISKHFSEAEALDIKSQTTASPPTPAPPLTETQSIPQNLQTCNLSLYSKVNREFNDPTKTIGAVIDPHLDSEKFPHCSEVKLRWEFQSPGQSCKNLTVEDGQNFFIKRTNSISPQRQDISRDEIIFLCELARKRQRENSTLASQKSEQRVKVKTRLPRQKTLPVSSTGKKIKSAQPTTTAM